MPKSKKTAKKSACKCCEEKADSKKNIEGKPIGKISHYFSNIGVAVIDLSAPLKVGDKIRVVGGEATDFEQEVSSMQIEHEVVKSAKKGDCVGMKVNEKVHEGYKVFKI